MADGFDLRGKVALITGGNSGIGLGMAKALAAAGCDVCVWGTNEAKNAAAKEELSAFGTRVAAYRCDVSQEGQVDECFARAVAELGKVDGCFANAGVGGGNPAPFHEQTLASWERVWAVNLRGVFFTLRAAAAHMVARGGPGRLVATSSLSTEHGAPRGEAYAASKGGLISLMRGLAIEYARYGITSNTVIPGWVATELTKGAVGNEKFEGAVIKRVPLRRWGYGEDYGGIAVYLMSDTSSYHTGDSFMIDGGYSRY